jgi:hypothetical protein
VVEYCWAIPQAAGRSCCGRSDSIAWKLGFQLDSLKCTYKVDLCIENCDGRKIRLPPDLPERNYCVSQGCLHHVKTNPQCHLPIINPTRTDLWSKPGLWGNRVNVPRSHLYLGRPQTVITITVSCELVLQPSCHHHTQFYSDS